MKPEHLAKHTDRIVAASRAFAADLNDDEARLRFLKATFNLDIAAQVIVALAEHHPVAGKDPPGQGA